MTQNKETPLIRKRNRISETDDVRAGINSITLLLTVQSARPCTCGLMSFCCKMAPHQLEMTERDMEMLINHFIRCKIDVTSREKGQSHYISGKALPWKITHK